MSACQITSEDYECINYTLVFIKMVYFSLQLCQMIARVAVATPISQVRSMRPHKIRIFPQGLLNTRAET
jgi:hypothetical protein